MKARLSTEVRSLRGPSSTVKPFRYSVIRRLFPSESMGSGDPPSSPGLDARCTMLSNTPAGPLELEGGGPNTAKPDPPLNKLRRQVRIKKPRSEKAYKLLTLFDRGRQQRTRFSSLLPPVWDELQLSDHHPNTRSKTSCRYLLLVQIIQTRYSAHFPQCL